MGELYTKRHLTVGQQVDLLASRGMEIGDSTAAEQWLSVVGYYRLSGYWYPYRAWKLSGSGRADQFQAGASFEQVVCLYDTDRRLKLLVLDALERIEIAVRVRVGHTLGLRGSHAHLDVRCLDGKASKARGDRPSRHHEWLATIERAQRRSTEDFVKHFRVKYDGRLPTWVVTEILDFGGLSTLFAMLQRGDRDRIAASLEVRDGKGSGDGRALADWLRVLTYLRNVCAHHSRLWNRNMTVQLPDAPLAHIPALHHLVALRNSRSRVYGPLCVVAYLLEQVAPDNMWCAEVGTLIRDDLRTSGRTCEEMGFPAHWEIIPPWTQV